MGLQLSLHIILSALIFPFTANFAFFGGISKFLGPLSQLSKNTIKFLNEVRPSQQEFENFRNIGATTSQILSKSTPVNLMASLSTLEISYGRFDSGDVGEFRSMFRNLISSIAGLQWFFSRIQERKEVLLDRVVTLRTRTGTVASLPPEHPTKLYEALHKKYLPVGEFESQRRQVLSENARENDSKHNLSIDDLDKLVDLVSDRYTDVLVAGDKAIEALAGWLQAANSFRLYSRLIPGQYKKHQAEQVKQMEHIKVAHENLLAEIKKLDEDRWQEVFHVEDELGPLAAAFIAQGALFGFSVKRYARVLARIMDNCETLDKTSPLPSLRLPFKKTDRAKVSFDHDIIAADQNATDDGPSSSGYYAQSSTEARDPDAAPPRLIAHLVGRKLVQFYNLLLSDRCLFALRTAVIGVVPAIPGFVRPTAFFYYSNRLIWVVIMTVISTADLPGDVIKAYIQKVIYTFLACVLGMVGWYISTGNGNGNKYGYAIVNIFLLYFLVCYRHFSKHTLPTAAIVLSASTVLVIGSSWQNTQAPGPGMHGFGFRVAWIRFVTVLVGVTLGSLASCFPKPKTGRRAVRNIISRVLRSIGNIHCDIGKFGVQRSHDPDVHRLPRKDFVSDGLAKILLKLASIGPLMKTLKYEPELTGPWPRAKYERLVKLCTEISHLSFSLYIVFDQLKDPEQWVNVVASRCGWTSSEMMTNFFAIIHMTSLSLTTGGPLPRVSPAQLTLKHLKLLEDNYHVNVDTMVGKIMKELDDIRAGVDIEAAPSSRPRTNDEASEKRIGREGVFGNLLSHDGQLCLVALLFSRMIYERMDELLVVVKGLVGEEFDYNPEFATDLDDVYETTKLLI
ncbi:hypothetical protein AWJ20_3575 [Sugiyamaella lignohabitans]|uniref:DUF2421 domain-containing protein n=1 Tax=Sugiyamaella lignohabitans TaxID=796027 RepID=A0A167G072_9ASCO|nr:uncharacterized protein AWJ20_3575 [Sugiyamaella lignohabitans]ANB15931.1 hypothetical protein AWJ20_3575 [Sugiyamaella lignohabitans]